MTYPIRFVGGPMNGKTTEVKDLLAIQVDQVQEWWGFPTSLFKGDVLDSEQVTQTTVYKRAGVGPHGEFIFQPSTEIEKEVQGGNTG